MAQSFPAFRTDSPPAISARSLLPSFSHLLASSLREDVVLISSSTFCWPFWVIFLVSFMLCTYSDSSAVAWRARARCLLLQDVCGKELALRHVHDPYRASEPLANGSFFQLHHSEVLENNRNNDTPSHPPFRQDDKNLRGPPHTTFGIHLHNK